MKMVVRVARSGGMPAAKMRTASAGLPLAVSTQPCSAIPAASMEKLRGLEVLILDALRHRPHPTHSTVENSLRIVEELKPQRTFFTHICHDLSHEETNAALPSHVRLSHDGLRVEFQIA